MSGITEEADRQHGKPQLSSASGSAMRAMHDSSSSWTDSSLPPKAKAAARQQAAVADIHTADAEAGQTMHLQQPAMPDGAVDKQRSTVVCVDQAALARPDAGVAIVAAPKNGMNLLILTASCISTYNTVHTVAHVVETGHVATIVCSRHKAVRHTEFTWQASMDLYAAQSAYQSMSQLYPVALAPQTLPSNAYVTQVMTAFGQICI